MTATEFYFIEGINPEPWEAPSYARGRGKPAVYKAEGLRAYQEAVAEEFARLYPEVEPYDEVCSVTFVFWRELAGYEVGDGRKSARHYADATNLQKATEDALQGLLFTNDRLVQAVESIIMEQEADTTPGILIVFRRFTHRPEHYINARDAMSTARPIDLTKHLHPDADVLF